ncbi:protein-disulfide reductase DsbD domain-containing protein [Moraxella sp. CTOTU49803]|uniref:cytochrome c biogenesis protein CcdA n=1 Tax=Moraxella sp. CTOTU49803 TaxID=2953840 RepID=UPI0028AE17F1|nr:protein-disulfide reductase DsbD domain-containing protein [Moraxella sp. CTOTU49803]
MSPMPKPLFCFRTVSRHVSLLGTLLAVTSLTMPSAQAISLSEVFGGSDNPSLTVKDKPLPVHEAFKVYTEQKGQVVTIHVDVKAGYYAYRDKLTLQLPDGVTATPLQFSAAPTYVDDPDFGRVPVFEQPFTATTTLSADKAITSQPATVKWQGCAKVGLCYPPEKTKFVITQLAASTKNAAKKSNAMTSKTAQTKVTNTLAMTNDAAPITTQQSASLTPAKTVNEATSTPSPKQALSSGNTAAAAQQVASTTVTDVLTTAQLTASAPIASVTSFQPIQTTVITEPAASSAAVATSLTGSASNQDIFGLTKHSGVALLLLFLAGLGLSFTPCVLPMLPIVANIVARQHRPSAKKGLLLTGSYGLGVATSYGILGAVVALFGQSLGILNWLQNPVILLIFAGLFILLGLYMLDVIRWQLPHALRVKFQRISQIGENRLGSLSGSYLTGLFSALVVSPCVSAPLAGALAGVAALGDPVMGFAALFLLGLGLSTPLILLGATQGNFMPKAGEWMNWVKTSFGLLLFGVALLMIERIWLSSWMLMLWALWFAVIGLWLWRWQGKKGQLLTQALALLACIWSACLVIGTASGSQDSWQPLNKLMNTSGQSALTATKTTQTIKITKLSQLEPLLAQYPKLVVDVTAEWCIECRIMDKTLFANPPQSLASWQVVKLDVTDNTPDSQAIYKKLAVFGPPVLLYYQNGQLVARQNGEVKRPDFEQILSQLN